MNSHQAAKRRAKIERRKADEAERVLARETEAPLGGGVLCRIRDGLEQVLVDGKWVSTGRRYAFDRDRTKAVEADPVLTAAAIIGALRGARGRQSS